MAARKIDKRADVNHDCPRRTAAVKFVDRERCELRWVHAVQAGSTLVHRPQTEEVRRVGAKTIEERPDESIVTCRGKQQTFVPLSPEGRRPLPAAAGRAE